jgi:hypothetical protein
MEIQQDFVNKVSESGLVSFDLATLYHSGERCVYDISENLVQGLLLREKDFRAFVKENDWAVYKGKNVAIICSTDAIVPTWAYMLLASKMTPYVNKVIYGDLETLEVVLFEDAIMKLDVEEYRDQRIVVKGCGEIPVPVSAYVALISKLQPVAKSLMYGEPCSTVPLYKRKD